jgi:hypothetical protein
MQVEINQMRCLPSSIFFFWQWANLICPIIQKKEALCHIFQQLSFEQHGSGVFKIHDGFCNIITQNVNLWAFLMASNVWRVCEKRPKKYFVNWMLLNLCFHTNVMSLYPYFSFLKQRKRMMFPWITQRNFLAYLEGPICVWILSLLEKRRDIMPTP